MMSLGSGKQRSPLRREVRIAPEVSAVSGWAVSELLQSLSVPVAHPSPKMLYPLNAVITVTHQYHAQRITVIKKPAALFAGVGSKAQGCCHIQFSLERSDCCLQN